MSTIQQVLQAITQGTIVRCTYANGRSHPIGGKRSIARHYRHAVKFTIGSKALPVT